jgi:hypothetical protein
MQAFEFSKQILIQMRHLKMQMLEAQENLSATAARPLRLPINVEVDYDPDKANPLREIDLHVSTGTGDQRKVQKYTLEVPAGTSLRREEDISDWLNAVFEFTAASHGMAVGRAEKAMSRDHANVTNTGVFLQPDEWSMNWVVTEGRLQNLPVEGAAVQMDRLAKATLEGWKESAKDDRMMVKFFKNQRLAEESRELMHLILEINGYGDRELRKDIKVVHGEGKTMLKMPKRCHDVALAAEKFIPDFD